MCLQPGTRTLSTSSILRRQDDAGNNGKPSGFSGAGFGAGAGLGSFGSFRAKQSTVDDRPPALQKLLPHEIEARKKMGLNAPKKKPARGPANGSNQDSNKTIQNRNQNRNQNQGQARGQNRNNNQNQGQGQGRNRNQGQMIDPNDDRRPRSTPGQQTRSNQQPSSSQISSSILAEAFKTNRAPAPVATPRSWSSTELTQSAQSAQAPASGAWGAFSNRKVDIQVPTKKRDSDAKGRPTSGTQTLDATRSKADGSAVWGQLKRASRDQKTSADKSKSTGGEFWDALENRVTNLRSRAAKSAQDRHQAYQIPPEEFDSSWAKPQSNQMEQQTKRKSRFEMDESNDSRKGKKGKSKQSSRRFEEYDDDVDEETIRKWEARQRRKAQKNANRLSNEETAAAAVPKMTLPEYISVGHLADALKIRRPLFLHDLESLGFEDLTLETVMTGDTAALVAGEYGFDASVETGRGRDLVPRPVPEDLSSLPSRPPVVTIMGHVDHGKTTLLDWLRKSSVAAQEHGGITQHIGAFVVQMSSGKQITFLDTPGHAAFLSMRQRGANVTDIVVLVVAADDSVMPQTLEALKHATAAKVPIIVAINKIDKEDARVDQVKADLARNGVEIEDYGGDVQVVPVSGKTGQGMEDLEENIVTLAEILDVRAEQDGMAEGWILESSVKPIGKSASVLVKRGTLRLGDYIAAGKTWAKIRAIRNEAGVEIYEAPPGTPVEILGWRELPDAGEQVLQSPDEDKAKTAVEYRQEMADRLSNSQQQAEQEQRNRDKAAAEKAAALAESEGVEVPANEEPGITIQNFVVKADVAGSVEAVCGTVQEIGSNEVQPKVLRSSVGSISEYDVDHAATSNSIIINFNSTILPHIRQRAEESSVRIIDHSVIYHVIDDVKAVLSDLLPFKVSHRVLGEADVLQIFSINIKKRVQKNIAGCKIRNGAIKRSSMVKVIRRGKVVYTGKFSHLLSLLNLHCIVNTWANYALQAKSTHSSMSKRTSWRWVRVLNAVSVSRASRSSRLMTRSRPLKRSRRSELCKTLGVSSCTTERRIIKVWEVTELCTIMSKVVTI